MAAPKNDIMLMMIGYILRDVSGRSGAGNTGAVFNINIILVNMTIDIMRQYAIL